MILHALDESISVAGQIWPEEVAALKNQGVTMIVNNRPDGEEYGQPGSADIEAAARAVGMDYRFIPVSGRFSADQVEGMASALAAAEGPVLAFCKSGTRSAFLWALARSRQGSPTDELVEKAAAAGYDLQPIRAYL